MEVISDDNADNKTDIVAGTTVSAGDGKKSSEPCVSASSAESSSLPTAPVHRVGRSGSGGGVPSRLPQSHLLSPPVAHQYFYNDFVDDYDLSDVNS
mmetsp:Transcript_49115/g.72973  ORF Transcript_49115/g.72973 Transcript_49115/m.72973 type:complete len:96 (-) Transcript_49115:235-522(-)|eukprot:CAMPEP_0195524816 /NCGR_PEP_ID=MMETSP0794_2-20130614/24885_1 /TAXON_ID=515487 /ORGANISM="Stephanopyxis turris, Strain CCMP 815" /LENGTH=95 /DNA_ID=CAMNT_0040655127 /DNA_START=190 /DNA_END=477 /DNA_ORIENTATION=-